MGGRVMSIFAHPDDAEIFCAGTLRLLVEAGCTLRMVTLSGGDLGASRGDPDEVRDLRLAEANSAAGVLGGDYRWAGLNDLAIFYNEEAMRLVTRQVRDFDPGIVITHAPECYMEDHQVAARLAATACFAAPAPLYDSEVPAIGEVPALYYADAMEGKDRFGEDVRADFYLDIATVYEAREEALACHASQREWLREHHGMDEYLLANRRLAELHGRRAGLRLAEGFRQHLGHGYPQENRLLKAVTADSARENEH
jgi:LmbE family N-acetylglucosaminyl deacetylase